MHEFTTVCQLHKPVGNSKPHNMCGFEFLHLLMLVLERHYVVVFWRNDEEKQWCWNRLSFVMQKVQRSVREIDNVSQELCPQDYFPRRSSPVVFQQVRDNPVADMANQHLPSYKRVLQSAVLPDDASWQYNHRDLPAAGGAVKLITVKSNDITLSFTKKPINRAVDLDAPDKFILISFANFRFPELPLSTSSNYVQRLLMAGIDLNGTTYRFYGHSNSQLRSRTCFLYAGSENEITAKINSMGDFSKITSVAKRAKRIGLLFSAAEMGYPLSSSDYEDIPDVEANGHVFTDGCGFISRRFARTLSRHRRILFRNILYMPSVFQIRYKGYKGIVTLNPELDRKRDPDTGRHPLIQFRDSMRKFKGCNDDTFSVVEYSKPYVFGKLNSELVTLLSCLGIPDEVFLRKQEDYFQFIKDATREPLGGFQFASYCNRPDLGEKLAMEGLEVVQQELRGLQSQEWAGHFDKRDQERVRIMIRDSRLVFGVSDPGTNLAEGECQVRISLEGGGTRTLDGAEVIVARNPCLHPGDIRKLRAVHVPEVLDHLVDCIVFSVQGERPAASLMSGGDLDGDKFFVCWDRELIPSQLYEAYEYPPAKEVPRRNISHDDMIKYFARFNSASLGRVKNCYLEWVRINGAGSPECQALNALFSSCVDGERVTIPERLQSPPVNPERPPFILDKLCNAVRDAACTIVQQQPQLIQYTSLDMVDLLVSWPTICLSEFEFFQLVHRWALLHHVPLTRFLWHFDFGAFTAVQKQWIAAQLPDTLDMQSLLHNGLIQSGLITPKELETHNLHWPDLHWKRLYTSYEHDLVKFFHYVETSLEQFHSKLIILRIDDRLTIAMYIPTRLFHNQDNVVDDSVRLLGFTPTAGVERHHRASTVQGYQLYFDGDTFQLFQGKRANTFVFIMATTDGTKGAGSSPVVRTSIALQKFNRSIQRHVGFVKKTPVMAAEIYVISNRDRLGHEILNIAMNQVDTVGDLIPLMQNIPQEYELLDLTDIEWSNLPEHCVSVMRDHNWNELENLQEMADYEVLFKTCVAHNGRGVLSQIVEYILNHPAIHTRHPDIIARILCLLEDVPMTVLPVLNAFFSGHRDDNGNRQSAVRFPHTFREKSVHLYLTQILLLATNTSQSLVLPELDRLLEAAPSLTLAEFSDFVTQITLTTRLPELVYELLHTFIIDHSPHLLSDLSDVNRDYFTRCAMAVAMEQAGEAADTCPCDAWGVPTGSSKIMITVHHKQEFKDRLDFQADLRLDVRNSLKKGDHIRLRAATAPTNKPLRRVAVLDAVVDGTKDGVLKLKLIQPPPPEVEKCSWEVFPCGSMVTTKVMMDSLTKLVEEEEQCCGVFEAIMQVDEDFKGDRPDEESHTVEAMPPQGAREGYENEKMNDSQKEAVVAAMREQLTLVWGPPGTGKTTVVVEILMQLTRRYADEKLLVTASTHNAVDNVLERFIAARNKIGIGDSDEIIRVATDFTRVSALLRKHTLDAFVGSNLHSDHRAKREADKKLKNAKVVFTTCTGAGLGILRDVTFHTAVIDEASQLAEPNALAPLVKGPRRVILVGDHVQLRPTVQPQADVYQLGTSLFERLYVAPPRADTKKVMLNVQYRMHPLVSAFPSREFYDGKLLDGVQAKDRKILPSLFPWPVLPSDSSEVDPVVLVQCSTPEAIGLSSKKNDGQIRMCVQIVKMLLDRPKGVKGKGEAVEQKHSIAILAPYKRQVDELKRNSDPRVVVSTIDAFQGREADIVIFSTVRCNGHGDLGFVTDSRRMNVALTRAKFGTIIVGDEATLSAEGGLWQKFIVDLQKVAI